VQNTKHHAEQTLRSRQSTNLLQQVSLLDDALGLVTNLKHFGPHTGQILGADGAHNPGVLQNLQLGSQRGGTANRLALE
jgi:hypothetical protein